MSMTSAFKSIIALYSELIWIYFGLAIFANIEWDVTELPDPSVWIIATFAGFFCTFLFRRWLHVNMLAAINGILLALLLLWSWSGMQSYSFGYRSAVLLSVLFLYLRSSFFVYKEPTRAQMLIRFEGNVIWYVAYILALSVNPSVQGKIHLPFMIAIILSLAGMVLTLYPGESKDGTMEIRMAGRTGRLPIIMLAILGLVSVMSFIALIPAVRNGIMLALVKIAEGMGNAWEWLLEALAWIVSLIPAPEGESLKTPPPPAAPQNGEGMGMGMGSLGLPSHWVVIILSAIGLFIALWLFTRIIPKRLEKKPRSLEISSIGDFSIRMAWRRFLQWATMIWRRWKLNFPHAYAYEIYWHFYLLKKWGKRRGLVRYPFESPRDYVRRISDHPSLPPNFEYKGKSHSLKDLILQLGEDYAYTYYTQEGKTRQRDLAPLVQFMKENK